MSGSNSSDGEIDAFDLGDFISEHSELFLIMGVFGALAIYISRSTAETPDGELTIQTGYVSAFGLSMLMYALVYTKLVEEFGDWNSLIQAHFRLRNAALAAFSLFSALLILSVSFVLTQHEPVVFLILLFATALVGVGVVLRILLAIARRIPQTATWRLSTLFLTSCVLLALTYFLRTRVLSQYETSTIRELSFGDPVPVVLTVATLLVATISSMAAIGLFSAILGIPIVIVDRIRGTGVYGETK